MSKKQKKIKLFMESSIELEKEIERLISNGWDIVQIVQLKDFSYPEMNGIAVTDWLIIYK